MKIFTASIVLLSMNSTFGHAAECKSIADPVERLKCFDSAAPSSTAPITPSAAKPPADDPLIAAAKAAVRKQLRDPGSARFEDVKIKTVSGKRAVCGSINAKNGAGGMTGSNYFVFDGKIATVLVTGPASTNPTSFDPDVLTMTFHNGYPVYEAFCSKT
jgi:hypothetical protein